MKRTPSSHSPSPASEGRGGGASGHGSVRRNLVAVMVWLGGAVVSGVLTLPAILAAVSPALKPRSRHAWRTVGLLDEFPDNQVVEVSVRINRGDWSRSLDVKSVYVWRTSQDDVVVFSRNCTDLSCPVRFDPGSECFFCPCHGGIFSKDGRPMAGPPSRPLYRYATRVRNGGLEIDLRSLPPMT